MTYFFYLARGGDDELRAQAASGLADGYEVFYLKVGLDDREDLRTAAREAMASGAAGVAFGRNVWGADDPGKAVSALWDIVHGG